MHPSPQLPAKFPRHTPAFPRYSHLYLFRASTNHHPPLLPKPFPVPSPGLYLSSLQTASYAGHLRAENLFFLRLLPYAATSPVVCPPASCPHIHTALPQLPPPSELSFRPPSQSAAAPAPIPAQYLPLPVQVPAECHAGTAPAHCPRAALKPLPCQFSGFLLNMLRS